MAFFSRHNSMQTAPQQWQTISSKVHQLMQLSKYDRALQMLETMLEKDWTNHLISASDLDTFYQYYGECLVQSHRLEEAIKVLSRGLELEPEAGDRCRETLEELAIPAVEKHIINSNGDKDTVQLILALETVSADRASKAVDHFLSVAGEAYRSKDFPRAAAAYESILPLAEQHDCVEFEDLIRAGESCVKSGQLNKGWKLYQSAQQYADTFSKTCRLHKKFADLLIIRNQEWHAIFHFLLALQAVPSDKGARTKLKKTLKKLGLENHLTRFLQLNTRHSDHKQLEISLMDLRKQIKAS